jgi:hypothetical protein
MSSVNSIKLPGFADTMKSKIIRTETKLKLLKDTYEKLYSNRRAVSTSFGATVYGYGTLPVESNKPPTFAFTLPTDGGGLTTTPTVPLPSFGFDYKSVDAKKKDEVAADKSNDAKVAKTTKTPSKTIKNT